MGRIIAQLRVRRLLTDGLILAAGFTLMVVPSVFADPMLWINDYPPDIRAAVGDPETTPPAWLIGVFFVFLAGSIVWVTGSVRRLRRDNDGGLTFLAAAAHALLVIQFVNVWDVVVIDWLLFATFTPAFAVLPGTEGMAGYSDYWFHFEASFLNPGVWIGVVVAALLIAGFERKLHPADRDAFGSTEAARRAGM